MATTLNQSLAEYGVSGNGLVEVSLNKTIEPIRGSTSYDIATVGQYAIKEDIRDGGVMQQLRTVRRPLFLVVSESPIEK